MGPTTCPSAAAAEANDLKRHGVQVTPCGLPLQSQRSLGKVITLQQADPVQDATTHRGAIHRLRDRARALKRDTYALYLAARDPRTPWYAKALAAAVVAYALSPIDLIPDFIPVIGYLDDLIIVPLGIAAVLRLMPADVLDDCRAQAQVRMQRPVSWVGAAFMVTVWLVAAAWLAHAVLGVLT